ncbi:MAG: HEAT repeat domain-containing protein [Nitrosomonas sp.]
MLNIFVSYDREDTDFSEVVQVKLHKAGYEIFMDQEQLNAGDNWREKIDQAIRYSQALIVIMTPEAAVSPYVNYEWAFALGAGVTVVPLELRATEFHPRLDVLQRLDFTGKSRPWEKLLHELEKAGTANTATTIPISEIAPPAVKRAVAALDNLDAKEHLLAIENLAQMDHPTALAALAKALNHPNKSIRIAAAFNYPDRKDPRILPGMFEVYNDYRMVEIWYYQKKESLLDTIEQMGVVAVPTLLGFLQHGNRDIRCEAIAALGALKPADAVQPLLDALKDTDEYVRIYAIRALGNFDLLSNESIAEHLHLFLQNDDKQIREVAVETLGKLKAKQAVDELKRLLQEDRSDIRSKAATALGHIGEKAALPALRAALKDKAIEKEVILALGFLGNSSAISDLHEVLCGDAYTHDARFSAAISLLRLRDSTVIPDIANMIMTNDLSYLSERMELIGAMANLGETAVSGLIDILTNEEVYSGLQEAAADALRRINTDAARAAVKRWEYKH